MKETWSLWECLSSKALVELAQYQWSNYGYRLEIPTEPGRGNIDTVLESPQEIDKLMRQPPSRSRGQND